MRVQRGFTVKNIGPNEARVLFDISIGCVALFFAVAFAAAYMPAAFAAVRWPIVALPALQVLLLGIAGIYSRLKAASGRTKAAVITGCVVATALLGLLFVPRPIVVLWTLSDIIPIVLSRLLLGLKQSNIRYIRMATQNDRGPVLVIGGAGYIGSHVVALLLSHGYRVRVLDKLMYGEEPIRDFISNPRFEFIPGDAADIGKLTMAMNGAQSVVHLAGLVGDPACAVDPEFTRHTNIIVTRMVRQVAQAADVRRFIFASSCSVYGLTDKEVSETDALNPVSLYAQTKIDSENELLTHVPDDFTVTILRFATVFGHSRRARYDLVANLFTAQAVYDRLITVTGASQWRPFVHVKDLARSVLATLEADPTLVQNQVFNVGDRKLNMTILQLAETVKRVVDPENVRISVRETQEDRRNYAVSFNKIEKTLGFNASVGLEEGIAEMATHLRNAPSDYKKAAYSNVEMTRQALEQFRDPDELAHLYGPLSSR